jgi:hypothetical protein
MAEAEEMPGEIVTGDQLLDFNARKIFAKRRGRAQQHGGRFPHGNFLVNPRLGFQAIGRRDEQPVHAARQHPAQAVVLAFRLIVGVGQQQIIAELVRLFLDGEDDAGIDRIRGRGDDEAEQLGGLRSQALGAGIRHIAHLQRERLDFGARHFGNVRLIAQRLGNRHHRNAGDLGNVF